MTLWQNLTTVLGVVLTISAFMQVVIGLRHARRIEILQMSLEAAWKEISRLGGK